MGTVKAKPHSHRLVMIMKRLTATPIAASLLSSFLAVPLATAAETGASAARNGGLNLSLSREDLNEAWTTMPMPNAPTYGLPDFNGMPPHASGGVGSPRRGETRRNDLPYGAGYEARQQGLNSGTDPHSGSAGTPSGRGMGRGR
jgi:hypothetical protein